MPISLLQAIVNVPKTAAMSGLTVGSAIRFPPGSLTHPLLSTPHNMNMLFGKVTRVDPTSLQVTLDLNQHSNPLSILMSPFPTPVGNSSPVSAYNIGPTGIALLTIEL